MNARRCAPVPKRCDSLRVAWYEPRVDVEITYVDIMRGELRDPVFRGVVEP